MNKLLIQKRILSIIEKGEATQKNVAERLGMSSQAIYRYWKELRAFGVLVRRGAFWEIDKRKAWDFFDNPPDRVVKARNEESGRFIKGSVRSHAYRFVVPKRFFFDEEKFLSALGYNEGSFRGDGVWWCYPKRLYYSRSFLFNGWLVELTRKNFVISINKDYSFFGVRAVDCDAFAIDGLIHEVLKPFERVLGKCLAEKDGYKFSVVGRHHARIKDAIAKEHLVVYGRQLLIHDKGGFLWYVTDDSYGNAESECLFSKTSTDDDEKVTGWYNSLREQPDVVTVSSILDLIRSNASSISEYHKKMDFYAENLASHVEAIKELSVGVNKFTDAVNKSNGFSSSLDEVKRLVVCMEDVFIPVVRDRIIALSVVDKQEFSSWYHEKFGGVVRK